MDALQIDVRGVLKSKNPKLARWIPRWVTALLARTIHQRQINIILRLFEKLHGVEFISSALLYMGIHYRIEGLENVRGHRRVIFASNHPLGGLDGLILAEACNQHLGTTKLVVNDILMNLTPIRELFVPINKHGAQSQEYARGLESLYAGDDNIIYFPAGLCSRRIDGVVQDTAWKKNFVTKAIASEREIVPVFVSGQNSRRFYRVATLRRKLRIKGNLEMLLLPDEMFRQKASRLVIRFGKPISVQELTRDTPENICAQIRKNVENMRIYAN